MIQILKILFVCLLLAPAALSAQDMAPTWAQVGVRVEKPAGDGKQFSQGSGISLGDGLILTAAHVIQVDPGNPRVTVIMDGWRVDGRVVAVKYSDQVDLALVHIPRGHLPATRRDQPPVAICPDNALPRQPMIVATEGTVSQSITIGSPISADRRQTNGWTNLLATGYHQGASGGGVFQQEQNCLAGIIYMEMGGKLSGSGQQINLTGFIPPSQIIPFLRDFGIAPLIR